MSTPGATRPDARLRQMSAMKSKPVTVSRPRPGDDKVSDGGSVLAANCCIVGPGPYPLPRNVGGRSTWTVGIRGWSECPLGTATA